MKVDLTMMGFSGWGTAGMFAMMVGILVVVAVAATAAVLLLRPVFAGGERSTTGSIDQSASGETARHISPTEILEESYARGEIDRAEFLTRRSEFGR